MKTDETTEGLIEGLARGLKPVPRLLSPGKRASVWSLGAAVYVVLVAAGMLWFAGFVVPWSMPFFVSQLIAVATGGLAGAAAFASVVPGSANRWRAWAVLAAAIWLTTLIVVPPADVAWAAVTSAPHEWLCVALILIGGAPLLTVLTSMLRRGAPLAPATTAGFAALAAALFINVAACVALPHTNGAVTFAWHGGVVFAAVVIAALCGHLLFRWRAAVPREIGGGVTRKGS